MRGCNSYHVLGRNRKRIRPDFRFLRPARKRFERPPGLVVMGDDSCLRGCGFESRRTILDGHDIFPHWSFVKKLYCLFEMTENKQKEAGIRPFKNERIRIKARADFLQRSVFSTVDGGVVQKYRKFPISVLNQSNAENAGWRISL